MTTTDTRRYLAPSRNDERFNRAVGWLVRHGVSVAGARVLAVRGRTSGEWRTTVVNLLELDGERYLVAPRGHTQWVRNLRAAGQGELRVGRRVEAIGAEEVADADKAPVLAAYLDRWAWEVGRFFEDLDTNDDATVRTAASDFPVFRLHRQPFAGGALGAYGWVSGASRTIGISCGSDSRYFSKRGFSDSVTDQSSRLSSASARRAVEVNLRAPTSTSTRGFACRLRYHMGSHAPAADAETTYSPSRSQ